MDEPKPLKPRRDFLFVATGAVAAFGVVAAARPVLGHMSAAGDTFAKARIGMNVDLSELKGGEQTSVVYRGRSIAIRHRTPAEIAAARADDDADMIDPQTDMSRLRPKLDGLIDPRFLVLVPLCTFYGCVVVGEEGRFKGWYCPCHGAHYDTSGRIRSYPAPKNLEILPYQWVSDTVIKLLYLDPS